MFRKNAVLKSQNVGSDPRSRQPVSSEAAMKEDIIAVSRNLRVFVVQFGREGFDKVE